MTDRPAVTNEQPEPPVHTDWAAVARFVGGIFGTLALMALGLAIGTVSEPAPTPLVILSTILVGSLLIVLGAMNRSRPIVAGGVTAFAVVLAVVGGCFAMFAR